MRRALTDAFLRSLRPPASGRLEVRDKRQRGLVLRLGPTGAAWSLRTQAGGRRNHRVALGTYPEVGLAEARQKAINAMSDVQRGVAPVAAARPASPTVAVRVAEWLDHHQCDWTPSSAAKLREMVIREIVRSPLGRRSLTDTTRADWTGLVTAKRRTAPGAATQLYRAASSFLNHAEVAGWIDRPLLPRRGLRHLAPAAPPRSRVLTDAELATVWQATAKLARTRHRAFVRVLILTGCRRSEAADLAAGELDQATWTIPSARAKNKQSITLPLGPLALAEIAAVWPAHEPHAGWRLFGHSPGMGVRTFAQIKTELDRLSGVTGWTLHDLRRTCRTGLARLGISDDTVEACLNHPRRGLIRTYNRHRYQDEILAALGKWQAHVGALVTDAPMADVVPLRRGQR